MDKKLIELDLKEEIAFWRMMEDDSLLRGDDTGWKNALFASSQRREVTRKLVELMDGKSREEYHADYLWATNEKQPTGVGAGELITIQSNYITDSLTQFGGMRNEYVS